MFSNTVKASPVPSIGPDDLIDVVHPHEDHIMIQATIHGAKVSQKARPTDKLKGVEIIKDTYDKTIKMGISMDPLVEIQVLTVLWHFQQVFVLEGGPPRMISADICQHHLNVQCDATPIQQKRHKLGPNRVKIVKVEVQ